MVARYLNGLRYNIEDEISLLAPKSVQQCFQMEMRVEEKLKRRQEKETRGRGSTYRSRGTTSTSRNTLKMLIRIRRKHLK